MSSWLSTLLVTVTATSALWGCGGDDHPRHDDGGAPPADFEGRIPRYTFDISADHFIAGSTLEQRVVTGSFIVARSQRSDVLHVFEHLGAGRVAYRTTTRHPGPIDLDPADSPQLGAHGDLLYTLWNGVLTMFDTSALPNLVVEGTVRVEDGGMPCTTLMPSSDDRILIDCNSTGPFALVDVTNPAAPIVAATGGDGSRYAAFARGRIFALRVDGLEVYDPVDLTTPTISLAHPINGAGNKHLSTSGNWLVYEADETHYVADITDPDAPVEHEIRGPSSEADMVIFDSLILYPSPTNSTRLVGMTVDASGLTSDAHEIFYRGDHLDTDEIGYLDGFIFVEGGVLTFDAASGFEELGHFEGWVSGSYRGSYGDRTPSVAIIEDRYCLADNERGGVVIGDLTAPRPFDGWTVAAMPTWPDHMRMATMVGGRYCVAVSGGATFVSDLDEPTPTLTELRGGSDAIVDFDADGVHVWTSSRMALMVQDARVVTDDPSGWFAWASNGFRGANAVRAANGYGYLSAERSDGAMVLLVADRGGAIVAEAENTHGRILFASDSVLVHEDGALTSIADPTRPTAAGTVTLPEVPLCLDERDRIIGASAPAIADRELQVVALEDGASPAGLRPLPELANDSLLYRAECRNDAMLLPTNVGYFLLPLP